MQAIKPPLEPSTVHPGLKNLDYLNPKLGSLYFRPREGLGLQYMTAPAFQAWKLLPSSQHAANRPFCVLLHDYGCSAHIYDKMASRLKCHCLALDLRGWGRSDETKDEGPKSYSVARMKGDVVRLVDLLQGEKFILVGHGMGAKVAQLYATQQPPKNFVGMMLLAPMPLGPWRLSKPMTEEYRAAYKTRHDLIRFTKTVLAHGPLELDELGKLVDDGMKDTPLAKEGWFAYGLGEDYSHGLSRVRVAALVRTGEYDKIIAAEDVKREVTDKYKAGLHLVARGCGHLIPVEDSESAHILDLFAKETVKTDEERQKEAQEVT